MVSSTARRRVANLLLVAGLLAIGIWAWFTFRGVLYQRWASGHFEDALQHPAAPPASGRRPAAPPAPKDGDLLGRLVVPRLGLHAMVREGAGDETLDVALGHIHGTAFPGQNGNVGVAGHRDTLFRGLGNIRKNDIVQFQTTGGTYEYQVESTQIVTPQTVSVLQPGKQSEITLVTCYPFHYIGPAPKRFIVKARLMNDAAQTSHTVTAQKPAPRERRARTDSARVLFQVPESHSRQVAPGISVGLSSTDAATQRVNGWLWFAPDRRTIWLRGQKVHEPVVFYGNYDGKRRELAITNVRDHAASGYLIVPDGSRSN